MASWAAPALPLLLVAALVAFEEWISTPSCAVSGGGAVAGGGGNGGDDLRAMMVADLMLLGSDASYVDQFFRDPFMSKCFSKSIRALKPDMLVVLGDISAKGSKLTERKWISVLQQFERMLGPSGELPLHITLGDRDIGECSKLDGKFVSQMASHLPGLDSNGCSTFAIGNLSFVSLNAVAMLCSNNALWFSIETVLERESNYFQRKVENKIQKSASCSEDQERIMSVQWKQNNMASGSGPVVLLHFPLHKSYEGTPSHDSFLGPKSKYSRAVGMGPYDLVHTLPANATEYILQALKPRIVFSAHSHSFSDRTHNDETREVTVPAMTWATRGTPGFVVVTFRRNGVVSVKHCSFAQEWHVFIGYISFLLVTALAVRSSHYSL